MTLAWTKDIYIYFLEIEYDIEWLLLESKASIGLRNIIYIIQKAESKWWNRLLKQEGKPPVFLKVDWDKWVDEDEEDEQSKFYALFYSIFSYQLCTKYASVFWFSAGADIDMGDIDFSVSDTKSIRCH